MAWKLKKANPVRDAGDAAAPAAGEQTIDYSPTNGAQPPSTDAQPVESPRASGDSFGTGSDAVDFFNSRTEAADDAISSFNFAKKSAQPAASGKDADHDDWSLDAFAPYQPPTGFDFSEPVSAASGVGGDAAAAGITHAGMIDFDAEPETLIGAAHSGATMPQSTPLEASDFALIDFDDVSAPVEALSAAEPIALHGGVDALVFSSATELAPDADEDAQFSDAGALDSYEASGVSSEASTMLNGFAASTRDFGAAYADAPPNMPLAPQPSFDEPVEALSAAQAPIPMPLPEIDFDETPQLAIPIAPPAADVNKTLIYGEAGDEPVAHAVAKPHLVVRYGPFTADYPITANDLVIGRPDPNTGAAPDVSLEYDDAVSRRHARVYSDGGQVMLEDLGSKNGTFLNGGEVQPNHAIPLKPGDKIRVGERTELLFDQ